MKRANLYKTEYNVIQYGTNKLRVERINYSRSPGWELKKDMSYLSSGETLTDSVEIQRISLSRTRQKVFDLCYSNDFTHFITLTINGENYNRYNWDEVTSGIRSKFHYIKSFLCRNFKYIIIYEQHVDGAYHFHGLVSGIDDLLELNDYGYLHLPYLTDKVGWNSFLPINISDHNGYGKVCTYISKYITKNVHRELKGKRLFFSSHDLTRPDRYIVDNVPPLFWDYQNDFVAIKDFFNMSPEELTGMLYISEKTLDLFSR